MRIVIETFQDSKIQEQRKLFSICFPEMTGTPSESNEYYYWKHHGLPANVKSYEYAAYAEGEMVGYYAAIPYQYNINREKMITGMVCDVMTHSKLRGRGVFTKIGRHAIDDLRKRGIHFATAFPIRPAVIPGFLKVGWVDAFKLPMYLNPLKTDAILESKKLGFLSPFVNLLVLVYHAFLGVLFVRNNRDIDFQAVPFSEFSDWSDYEKFFNVWSKTQRNYLEKSQSFLKWRLSAPESSYWVTTLRSKGNMVGFAISRFNELDGIPTLAVLDYMLLDDFLTCSPSFVCHLKSLARKNKAHALVTMMSKTCAKQYQLMKSGFLESPYVFTMILKKLNVDISDREFYAEKSWHLMWLDSDDL